MEKISSKKVNTTNSKHNNTVNTKGRLIGEQDLAMAFQMASNKQQSLSSSAINTKHAQTLITDVKSIMRNDTMTIDYLIGPLTIKSCLNCREQLEFDPSHAKLVLTECLSNYTSH